VKKTKAVVAWNAGELAKALGLTPADGAKIELQSDLNTKIAEVVARVTAILNRHTKDISTDLMLRVLYALGYTAKVGFKRAAGDVLQKGVW
jgi:roadblock/LC7 domain-containing protein